MKGLLSIVATPIGNLEDIGLRALHVLQSCDVIACEDTRVTAKLLSRFELSGKSMRSLHQHSSDDHIERLLSEVEDGRHVAYVSDAGTPNVNDPGGRLVERAYDRGIRFEVIPGPSALTAAIASCGFPMEQFVYAGFIPQKKHRAAILADIGARREPTVFFESTHRIRRTLEELARSLDDRRTVYVGRELTKKFETHYRGTVGEVLDGLGKGSSKGEFVVIVGPSS
jgi:16S rRNA (cytidine1402-2'-O)-methyltransferase